METEPDPSTSSSHPSATMASSTQHLEAVHLPVTMASSTQHLEAISIPVSNLLLQIATSVKSKAPETLATVPSVTTWTSALHNAEYSLRSVDQQLAIFPKTTRERQKALQETTLSVLAISTNTPSTSGGLPIKTNVLKHQTPPRSSPAIKARLQELAKENIKFGDREPYHLRLDAEVTEKVLPVVTGTLRLRGLDKDLDNEMEDCCLDVNDMLSVATA